MRKNKKILLTMLLSGALLSSCGKAGPQGEQGPKGEPGIKGEKGDDGLTPTISINEQNHWVINGDDTGVSATGNPGVSPTISISEDGYWVINGTKTSTLAKGVNGKDGVSITSIEKIGTDGSIDTYKITFSDNTSTNFKVTNGTDGKSAYELYCLEYDYEGSLAEWLEKFYSEDDTDYSNYDNFEFVPMTYGGVKGYSASYIGTGGEVVIPETFNKEPVLAFKFGFNDIHEILEEDPGYRIESIYVPSNVKSFAINGNSNYALHCLNDTVFIFTDSLDEVIYSNYVFETICFDGSFEELEKTNLIEKFPISNIETKDGEGNYIKTVVNFDIFTEKYSLICEQINIIQEQYIPDGMTKFEDGEIIIPNQVTIRYDELDIQIPIKIKVDEESSVLSFSQNKLTYKSSEIDRFKGKDVFLVEFTFDLEGKECIATSSTVIVSKMPNIFKTFDQSFNLVEYDEVEDIHVGDKYSHLNTVKFTTSNKVVKAYYDDGFGEYETAMPDLESDSDNPHSSAINYDKENGTLTCLNLGEYSLGFAYLKHENKYVFYATELSTFNLKLAQLIYEAMQDRYTACGNTIYVKVGDSVTFPENIEFDFEGVPYNFLINIKSTNPSSEYLIVSKNTVTFKLDDCDKIFETIDYIASQGMTFAQGYIAFKITK